MAIRATIKTKIICMVILIIIGSFMIGAAMYEIQMAVNAHSWEKREAEVIKSEIMHSRGDNGGWYSSIKCVFKKSGNEFNLRRISYGGISVGGSGKGRAEERVREYPVGKKFFVYVCPEDNSKIIVKQRYSFTEMRVIQSIGAGLIVFAFSLLFLIKTKKKTDKESPAEKKLREQPWMREKKWAEGRIKCMSGIVVWVIGIFALVWNAISWGVVISAWDQIFHSADNKALVALLFPAVGFILIIFWLIQILRYMKFGNSFFQMNSIPGVIGGKLEGVVHIPKHIEAKEGFKVALTCIKRVTSGSGKNRSSFDHVMHQEEMVIAREMSETDYTQTLIPILFAIPFSTSLQSGRLDKNTTVTWILTVKAKLSGADYNARFEVPVFRTEESSPDFKLDTSGLTGYMAEITPDEILNEQRINHKVDIDKETFFFPMLRSFGTGLGILLGSIIFSGAAAFLFRAGPLPMAVIFGLVGWFIGLWGIDVLFWSSRVEMLRDGIRVKYGLFRLNSVQLPYNAVNKVNIKRGMQSGETLFHSVLFEIKDGKKDKIPVGKRIRNRKVAEALVDMYENSILQEGKTLSEGKEFLQGGQRWSLWKARLLVWGSFLLFTLFMVSLKFGGKDVLPKIETFFTKKGSMVLLKEENVSLSAENNRSFQYPISIPETEKDALVLEIEVSHSYDDSGDKGMTYKLLDSEGKKLKEGFMSSREWFKIEYDKVKPNGKYTFILEDLDTKLSGKYAGNKGKIRARLLY